MRKINPVLFIFVFLLFVICIVLFAFLNIKPSGIEIIKPSVITSTPVVQVTKPAFPTNQFINFSELKKQADESSGTGAVIEAPPEDEIEQTNARFNLRNMLPVMNESFKITYNYTSEKFEIIIYQPYDENLKAFKKWITDNGLSNIPQEDLDILNKF